MSASSATILIVDDEPSIVDMASKILEKSGYRVLKAQHSDEALILLDGFRETVHLLLTDVKMDPYMTGCELAKCVRIIRPEISVIYISGLSNNLMVQQEVEDCRASFLAKPFYPQELVEKVHKSVATFQNPLKAT